MKVVLAMGVSLYAFGFFVVFLVNMTEGPVTMGLSLARAIVWPYFIATGRPEGHHARMD